MGRKRKPQTPESLEKARAWQREYQRQYRQRPGMKERLLAYQKIYRFGTAEQRRELIKKQSTPNP